MLDDLFEKWSYKVLNNFYNNYVPIQCDSQIKKVYTRIMDLYEFPANQILLL